MNNVKRRRMPKIWHVTRDTDNEMIEQKTKVSTSSFINFILPGKVQG